MEKVRKYVEKKIKAALKRLYPSDKLAERLFTMVTAEKLEAKLDQLLNVDSRKEELFKFLSKHEGKIDKLNKTKLAEEIGISTPTLRTWIKDYKETK